MSLSSRTPAKDAIAQILINSRMCAEGHRPICQDTGIVTIFIKLGMQVQLVDEHGQPPTQSLQQLCDEGVRRAWLNPENKLRGSILRDPAFSRKNTIDNTPCVVEVSLVPGSTIDITVAAKGGGSEAKSKFVMLNPSDSVLEWVLKTVPTMGAGWCPPGMLGIGIGGTAEKAMLLAKQSLMDPIDMQELKARGPVTNIEQLRINIYDRVNDLGIGAQGLGGLTTVLDIKILDYPTHAANLPVAMIPNCAATRHAHFILEGNGPVFLDPPSLEAWPKLTYDTSAARRVDLATVTRADVETWLPGEVVLLSGKLLTGRDAAHKRLSDMLNRGEALPVDFTNRFIYYVGPVDAVRDEAVGPAGPTTATRMDKFTRQMLAENRPPRHDRQKPNAATPPSKPSATITPSTSWPSAAPPTSSRKQSKHSQVLAFEDLGMEAIYEFEVVDMPVTVAVTTTGTSVHKTGPAEWQARIAATHQLAQTPILGQ